MQAQYDIAIVGAGLVGSSLACALASTAYRIVLIDSQPLPFDPGSIPKPDTDGRSIALALASKKMFGVLGVWQHLADDAAPIKKIHISEQGQFGATRLDCTRYEVESFGYLVPAATLITALQRFIHMYANIERLQPYKITTVENSAGGAVLHGDGESIHAKLLIAADGTHSSIRNQLGIAYDEKQYRQTAIVGCIDAEYHHQHTAYERFTGHGTLALLPRVGNRCGFIWMNPTEIAQNHLTLTDKDFLNQLQQAFGFRLGHFSKLGRRVDYPLTLLVSKQRVQQRAVLVGNAAQTLHPVAGQGLNLALGDIAALSETLAANESSFENIEEHLHAYEAKRQPDIEKTIRFTDQLNFLFTADYPVLSRTRGLGLALLGAIPALEARIVQRNLGALGLTRLLRGQTLQP